MKAPYNVDALPLRIDVVAVVVCRDPSLCVQGGALLPPSVNPFPSMRVASSVVLGLRLSLPSTGFDGACFHV